jgi:hypothetical protein
VRDKRKPAFCWAANDAIAVLVASLDGLELNSALGVYQGLTYLASQRRDGDHAGFEAPRSEILETCGVTSKKLTATLDRLVALKVLEVEVGGGNRANTYALTDPPAMLLPPVNLTPPVKLTGGVDSTPHPLSNRQGDPLSNPQGALYREEERKKEEEHTAAEAAGESVPNDDGTPPFAHRLAAEFAAQLGTRFRTVVTATDDDRSDIEAWVREHNLEVDQASQVLEWVHRHAFWASRVKNTAKLRQHYPSIRLQMHEATTEPVGLRADRHSRESRASNLEWVRRHTPELAGEEFIAIAASAFGRLESTGQVSPENVRQLVAERMARVGTPVPAPETSTPAAAA